MNRPMPRLIAYATHLTAQAVYMQQLLGEQPATPLLTELWGTSEQVAAVAVELERLHLHRKLGRELEDYGPDYAPSKHLRGDLERMDRSFAQQHIQAPTPVNLVFLALWALARLEQKDAPQVSNTCEAA